MIGKSVRKLILDNLTVTSYVSDRVFPVIIPQTAPNPCIVYGIADVDPIDTKVDTSYEDKIEVEIMVYADSYDDMHDISKAVRIALDKKSGNIEGNVISDISFDGFNDGYQSGRKCYAGVITFKIMSKP